MTATAPRYRGFLACVAVSLASGCAATPMYPGPRRPSAETAIIDSGGNTTVLSIDGQRVNGGLLAKYELVPGNHLLVLSGSELKYRIVFNEHARSPPMNACLDTRAGHVYLVTIPREGDRWRPQVLDTTVGSELDVTCSELASPVAAPLPTPRPGSGFHIGIGASIGGEVLTSAMTSSAGGDTLGAGDGQSVSLGGTLMPLWIRQSVGLGVGGSIGWKFDEAEGNGVSLHSRRFPLGLWLQSLVAVSERWYVAAAGGAQKELGVRMTGSGLAGGSPVRYEAPVGWTGELGMYFAATWHLAMGFGLRYTAARYQVEGRSIDASNVALNLTMHLNP